MGAVSELMVSLQCCFNWNKARLFCLSAILIALMGVRTVTLREIVVAFAGNALLDLRYRRLHRFFAYFKLDYTAYRSLNFQTLFKPQMRVFRLRSALPLCTTTNAQPEETRHLIILSPSIHDSTGGNRNIQIRLP